MNINKIITPLPDFFAAKHAVSVVDNTLLGKHKIKRFLYHITSQDNYEKIMESGILKTYKDSSFRKLNGIFMFDLQNFTKRWCNPQKWGDLDLAVSLFAKFANCDDEIVKLACFRIPTEKLDHSLLKIRSQNRLFKIFSDNHKFFKSEHTMYGSNASQSSLYKKRKEAIEYIYQDNLPVSDIQFVGKFDFNVNEVFEKDTSEWYRKCALKTLKELFKDQPERKGLHKII